jgi:hypothetical protein
MSLFLIQVYLIPLYIALVHLFLILLFLYPSSSPHTFIHMSVSLQWPDSPTLQPVTPLSAAAETPSESIFELLQASEERYEVSET